MLAKQSRQSAKFFVHSTVCVCTQSAYKHSHVYKYYKYILGMGNRLVLPINCDTNNGNHTALLLTIIV